MEGCNDDSVSVSSLKIDSTTASSASAAVTAQVKAKAAWVCASFLKRLKAEKAEKKAWLQSERAKLDADFGALSLQREAVAAIAHE